MQKLKNTLLDLQSSNSTPKNSLSTTPGIAVWMKKTNNKILF